MRVSLGSVMESQSPAKSMLASFRTFQFLWNSRSSHGNFFASFNNFSSSDISTRTIYDPIHPNLIDLCKCRQNSRERNRARERECVLSFFFFYFLFFFCLSRKPAREEQTKRGSKEPLNAFLFLSSLLKHNRERGRECVWGGERMSEGGFLISFFLYLQFFSTQDRGGIFKFTFVKPTSRNQRVDGRPIEGDRVAVSKCGPRCKGIVVERSVSAWLWLEGVGALTEKGSWFWWYFGWAGSIKNTFRGNKRVTDGFNCGDWGAGRWTWYL